MKILSIVRGDPTIDEIQKPYMMQFILLPFNWILNDFLKLKIIIQFPKTQVALVAVLIDSTHAFFFFAPEKILDNQSLGVYLVHLYFLFKMAINIVTKNFRPKGIHRE